MLVESHARSALKAFSWRALGTLATALLVFVVSGELDLAVKVGVAEFVAKYFLYFLHERIWSRIRFGIRSHE